MGADDVLFALADPCLRARFALAPGVHRCLDELTDAMAEVRPGVVIVDDGDETVIERCAALREHHPNVRLVVLAAGARDVAWRTLRSGASSVLSVRADVDDVLDAARAAPRGESVLDAPTAGLLLAHMRRTAIEHNDPFERVVRLTEIEDELLSELAKHHTLAHIAVDRRVSERLVCVHVGYAVAKLHDPAHRPARPVQSSLADTARRLADARRSALEPVIAGTPGTSR